MKPSTAANCMIFLLSMVLLYHTAVLIGIIDFTNAWGGRLTSKEQMYVFETVSVIINLFLLFIILQKANYIKRVMSLKTIHIILWVFVFVFAINTLGNIFAESLAEKIAGTILTLLSSIFCWIMVISNNTSAKKN